MFVSATPRYQASSLNPLSKRGDRGRGARRDPSDLETPEPPGDDEPTGLEDSGSDDLVFDVPDEALGYSTTLVAAPVETATASAPVQPPDELWSLLGPVEPIRENPATTPVSTASPEPEGSLFALLDRVTAKP